MTFSLRNTKTLLNPDYLEDCISSESQKLIDWHLLLPGEITLLNLQSKLINHLKSLLHLITQPASSPEEVYSQLLKIYALYRAILGEMGATNRRKHARLEKERENEIEALEELIRKDAAYHTLKPQGDRRRYEEEELCSRARAQAQALKQTQALLDSKRSAIFPWPISLFAGCAR